MSLVLINANSHLTTNIVSFDFAESIECDSLVNSPATYAQTGGGTKGVSEMKEQLFANKPQGYSSLDGRIGRETEN